MTATDDKSVAGITHKDPSQRLLAEAVRAVMLGLVLLGLGSSRFRATEFGFAGSPVNVNLRVILKRKR